MDLRFLLDSLKINCIPLVVLQNNKRVPLFETNEMSPRTFCPDWVMDVAIQILHETNRIKSSQKLKMKFIKVKP